jgi:outer membrane protein assembly factor BamB
LFNTLYFIGYLHKLKGEKGRMVNMKSKTKTITISVILILAMAISLIALPNVSAQESIRTYAFIGATPNPVGVGQEVLLHVGISQQTPSTYLQWKDLSVTITTPSDHTITLDGLNTDATGGLGRIFTPDEEGTYTVQTHFPAQEMSGQQYAASDSEVLELVVQSEPIPYWPGIPMPTEYWTRPINAQFFEWASIAGNWLRPAGSYTMPPIPKQHDYNEDAPNTAHILWTKPYAQGGLTGGPLGDVQYEMGDAYVGKFLGSVIIDGVLYYNAFQSSGGTGIEQNVIAMNLKTGEELWVRNWDNTRLAFGQVYFFDSFNYHGAFAYLWTTTQSTWDAYDALTGRWVYRLENVPSGYNLYGPKGEIIRYTVSGNTVSMWNSSKAVNPQTSGSVGDGSWTPMGNTYDATQGIQWTATIPETLPGSIAHYSLDRIFGTTSWTFPSATGPTLTSWVLEVDADSVADGEADVAFNYEWTVPSEVADANWVFTDVSFEDDIFIISCKEDRKYYGFSLENGQHVWTSEPEHYLAFYDKWYGPAYGYGNFYTGRQSGIVTCYNITTGETKWKYNVADEYAEILWSANFPIEFHFLADGKICLSYGEHSPIIPTGRGAPMVVLDSETGEEIWKLSWFNNWWGGHVIIGDSIMAGMNAYDNRLYSIGKGPSSTTIEASPKISVEGDSVLVEGTVMDISPGTAEYALTARFPDGVPAVSDNNMTDWMQYVYMQYPRPTDVMGVDVTISVLDSNGNVYEVATATSDANGFYCATFTPPVPGKYVVYATFSGSESYWPSSATTALNVESAPQPTAAPTATPGPMTDTYVLGLGLGSIIAIVVIGLVLILMLRKR